MRASSSFLLAATGAAVLLGACVNTSGDTSVASTAQSILNDRVRSTHAAWGASGYWPYDPWQFAAAWEDVGVSSGGDPVAASWGAERLDVFVRDGETLYQKAWLGGWAPAGDSMWPLAKGLATDPSAVGWAGKNLDLVWRTPAGNVVHMFWNGTAWTTEDLKGWVSGKPTISVTPDGTRMDVFARAGDQLWHRAWSLARNAWIDWEPLDLKLDSDPVAISNRRGHIDLFWRASNGETRRYYWDGNAAGTMFWEDLRGQPWVDAPSLGGYAKGLPTAATHGDSIEVFVQGGDDVIYQQTILYNVSSGRWDPLDGCSLGAPTATSNGDNELDVFARSKDSGRVLRDVETYGASTKEGPTPLCCGRREQHDCGFGLPCEAWSKAGDDGVCRECGEPGEACCPLLIAQYCDVDRDPELGCYANLCQHAPFVCGDEGQPVCPASPEPTCNRPELHPNLDPASHQVICTANCGTPNNFACRTQYPADGGVRSRYKCWGYARINASPGSPTEDNCICVPDTRTGPDGDTSANNGYCLSASRPSGDIPDPPDCDYAGCSPN